ncbi:MAG: hypothetical protein R2798_05845 [Chitinophagales bacterium]|nr:hypothetical protein [Bacteroidota bacterium]MCB9044440.1 hypothetical protein [Chitinophagales bacterium]
MSNEKFDDLIKQKLENFAPNPPPQLWDKVRHSLENAPPAAAQSRFRLKNRYAAAIAMGVAIFSSLGYFLSNYSLQVSITPKNSNNIEYTSTLNNTSSTTAETATFASSTHHGNLLPRDYAEASLSGESFAFSTAPAVPLWSVLYSPLALVSAQTTNKNNFKEKYQPISLASKLKPIESKKVSSKEEQMLATIQPQKVAVKTSLPKLVSKKTDRVHWASNYGSSPMPNFPFKGLYAGFEFQKNLTHIYNNINAQNWQEQRSTGEAYWLKIGYDINKNWAVETGFVPKTRVAQNYTLTENETPQAKVVELVYRSYPMVVKYKKPHYLSWLHAPASMNFFAGFAYNTLRTMYIDVAYLNAPLAKKMFHQNQLAYLAGVDYDVYLTHNHVISLGSQVAYSDTFLTPKGNRQLAVGAKVAFKYRFVQ